MSFERARRLWWQQLESLHEALAIATDAAEKHRLNAQIAEAEAHLGLRGPGREFLDLRDSAVDWDLLRGFFRQCAARNPSRFAELAGGAAAPVDGFLVNSGLARKAPKGGYFLTEEGVLLCARWDHIPRDVLHVSVAVEWRGAEHPNEDFFGSVLLLHRDLLKVLEPLSERAAGNPHVRSEAGSETVIHEYPRVAVIEALTNFLIHRDYNEDDHGRINVTRDFVEFINPGISLVAVDKLLEATAPLEPKYRRNPRLIEVMNMAGFNQRKGSGILRIRDSLAANGSVKPDGTVGLELWNDEEKQRFHLKLYRRDLKQFTRPGSGAPTLEMRQRIAPSRLPRTGGILVGRDAELARLDEAWSGGKVNVLSLVAWGGVGKSALAGQWVARLAAREFDGADYFDWSFYSQGTRDEGSPSGEAFIHAALRFFGDEQMAGSAASAWDKGARLAQLVAARRALLVLDGLEPLQHPAGPLGGELRDPAVRALLLGLAQLNAGLCVVTTRETVTDLAGYRGRTVEEWKLAHLSLPAGVALLESLGVHGASSEIEELVHEAEGHALTLSLLGSYLARAHGGDVRRRDRVDLQQADAKTRHGHAFQAMAAYERWLGEGGESGQQQLAILRLLGLFDRAASYGAVAALRQPPVIAGLTEPFQTMGEADWNEALANLQAASLGTVSCPDSWGHGAWAPESSLEAHPLIREYFGRELRTRNPAGWRAAHDRLYEYLRDTTEYRPATLEALQPLYQAVVHGCQAGRHKEVCDAVYHDRILRGTGPDGFYSWRRLGAFGADLGALACFFDERWSRPSTAFSSEDQAWLLNEAAVHLRALGRLREALEPMRGSLEADVSAANWKGAAISAANLCELEETLGELERALDSGERAVACADRSADPVQRTVSRAALATAEAQAGLRDQAMTRFREAEALQAEWQPEFPLLYSNRGFNYGDLLLTEAEQISWTGEPRDGSASLIATCEEVEARAATLLQWRAPADSLQTVALDHLMLGRSRLYRALLAGTDPVAAASEIEAAVASLRAAGDSTAMPLGLLTRARLRWHLEDLAGAREDLDEAWEIASRGPMPLFQADVGLVRARILRDREALREARNLIERHGYGRRRAEMDELELRLPKDEAG